MDERFSISVSFSGYGRRDWLKVIGPSSEMSLLVETSLGDIVIDLEVDACPKLCQNFVKLCKLYYYNLNAFFNGSFHPRVIHVA